MKHFDLIFNVVFLIVIVFLTLYFSAIVLLGGTVLANPEMVGEFFGKIVGGFTPVR